MTPSAPGNSKRRTSQRSNKTVVKSAPSSPRRSVSSICASTTGITGNSVRSTGKSVTSAVLTSDRNILEKTNSSATRRDTHLRVLGPVVKELEFHFEQDWDAASNERTDWSTAPIPPLEVTTDRVPVQIVTSGPTSETEYLKNMLIQMIHSAEKSVYIQSPYFIPDASFMDACQIALASGVSLKIMIPNQPDHPVCLLGDVRGGRRIDSARCGSLHVRNRLHACEDDCRRRKNRLGRDDEHRRPEFPVEL